MSLLALACAAAPAAAEKADRYEKLKVEADRQGKIDLANNLVVFEGNVVVTKGTMVIQAARVELRETPGGYHSAVATGGGGKPASFRQKRDGVDETIEGEADRLEYDGRAETVKFINRAAVRRMRGAAVADEISGNLVSYDSLGEVFSVTGGNAASAGQNGGRVRAVLTPRASAPSAEEAASRPAPQLKLSPTLGEQR
ncbi:MAG: lipopolysaccharide transport periplasmic protein LptA [Rhizobacter sp.]|nr:lipopolysaccharide transport periplasmic protein LptA [Rhizobacter sp.]